MEIALDGVSKGGGRALPPTSISYGSGRAVLACAETQQRPSVLGLIASGRMRPETGTVLIDGRNDRAAIRRRVALVDAPAVCEPADEVTVADVTAEELMFAGRLSHPRAVHRALDELGLTACARQTIGTLAARDRIRMLAELALLRRGVDGIVLTAPDRHGGDPGDWWETAGDIAARGHAVLVIAGEASAAAIGARGLVARLQTAATAGDRLRDDEPSRDDTDACPIDTLSERGPAPKGRP